LNPGHRLKIENILEAQRVIDPVFLGTPQRVAEAWSARLDLKAVIKDETANPIRCFKGRGAEFVAATLPPRSAVITASAGNFGQAMAHACVRRGHTLTVYAAATASPLKIERMRTLGAAVVLHGQSFDEAKAEARRSASRLGVRMVEDSLAPETGEGAGTIGVELASFPESPQAVLLPLGDGALACGVGAYLKWARPNTRIVAVQAEGAPAMIESWHTKRLVTHASTHTIADGIAGGRPIPECLQDLESTIDEGLLVSEASIREAMRWAYNDLGIMLEPAGAVSVAALLEHRDQFRNQTVAMVLSGGNIAPDDHRRLIAP
jgi:threonine dehydratase